VYSTLYRFEIVICRVINPGDDKCLCLRASFACAMLEAMSGCLESIVSCSGVGPGGSCWKEVCNMFCHLVEIGVNSGSCLVSVLVRERRCFGETALSSFRKYSRARYNVVGMRPSRCGLAHRNSVSDSM